MQVFQPLIALVILAPFLFQATLNQITHSTSGDQLLQSQNVCFPGLFYSAQYNTCDCLNATRFGEGIVCQTNEGTLRELFFCVTSDSKNPEQVVGGTCPYQLRENLTLPTFKPSQEEMNDMFCGQFNRNCTLCGKCAENYSLVINSYDYQCTPSSRCSSWNVVLYLISSLGPITAFYVLIFILQVNVAASYMFPFVLYAQTVTLYILHIQTGLLLAFKSLTVAEIFTKILISSYSIWILDVLTLFMPPICISNGIDNVLAISFQYLIALYPLLMIMVSYFLVELYDRNFRVVVWMFFPIKKCLSSFHVKVDLISSLLTTFATFFFLSFSRMTITSLMLLSYTDLFAPNGTLARRVFLYDATMDYFGHEHLPYAMLAIIVAVFFILLPLLLVLLYPTKTFQKILRLLCQFQRIQMLTAFMEVYQGHFKDGTDGSRDYRYFAGGQLLMRLVSFVAFFQTQQYIGLSFLVLLIISVGWSLIILLFTPYKSHAYNRFEGFMMLYTSTTVGICFYNLILELLWQKSVYSEMLLYVVLFLPAIAAMLVFCVLIGQRCACPQFWRKIKFRGSNAHVRTTFTNDVVEDQQPLLEANGDGLQYSSSDNVFTRDRLADQIGYGSV